jgi:RHS repeat-associated protein
VRVKNNVATYPFNDYLGTPMMVGAQNGTVPTSQVFNYTPFGESVGVNDPGNSNEQGYTGHVEDPTGLTYMQARYYDPVMGRFLATDPVGYLDQLNLYANVHNDPTNNLDLDGRSSIKVHFRDQVIRGTVFGKDFDFPQSMSNGHFGVVVINDQTGLTRYREFGRYDGTKGKVRGPIISNLVLDQDGIPTAESLELLLGDLMKIGEAEGAADIAIEYQIGGDFDAMMSMTDDWANTKWSPFGKTCHSFCDSVVDSGGSSGVRTKGIVVSGPAA